MNTIDRVAVVGAGAAGVDCAAELRRLGFQGEVVIFGAEAEMPYDRPPLSKEYLTGAWGTDRLALQPAGFYDHEGIDLRVGVEVLGLGSDLRSVVTRGGPAHPYDALVIATGLRPRLLGRASDERVLTLRNRRDAEVLRARVASGGRIAVVGTGYLGCELAASCVALGARVTLIGPDSDLLGAQLSRTVGSMMTRMHREHGVDVRLGVTVRDVVADGAVRRLRLSDGMDVDADLVVVAVGSTPNVEWLEGSGLGFPEGVRCASDLQAAPGIWVAGDVAAVRRGDGWGRHEHRLHATESALHVAAGILGRVGELPPSVPYVWSDQFSHRLQIYGQVPAGVTPRFAQLDPDGTKFVAVYAGPTGDVEAVVGCDSPRATRLARAWVVEGRPLSDVPDLLSDAPEPPAAASRVEA